MMKQLLKCAALSLSMAVATAFAQGGQTATAVLSLDGTWSLALDPANVGREQKWFEKAQVEGAKPAQVPWIIQEAFPECHGVVWYAREFDAPLNPHPGGRCLLRFWQVDYLADVWVNGKNVGGHEGGETPFVLDVTDAVKPGGKNRLTVRVLNP
ncbi:glycoside hydrolase family 2, partial [bacterium]|nr:glycoside hydrolase family 2 [bacterium]